VDGAALPHRTPLTLVAYPASTLKHPTPAIAAGAVSSYGSGGTAIWLRSWTDLSPVGDAELVPFRVLHHRPAVLPPPMACSATTGPRGATVELVAYDEALADRIRELLAGESDVSETRMFGGLAFLIAGNMAVAASGQGGLMVRVDPAKSDSLVAKTGAYPMEMRGRPMQGWLRVNTEDVRTMRQLAKWVELGTARARSLPPKR
jgi:TfoX/Sxy family transcriptional regulator of competence genes